MTKDNKITKEQALAEPQRYRILDGGAIYDNTLKRIVSHTGEGRYQITAANAAQMVRRKRDKFLRGYLEGLIEGAGGKVTDVPMEELYHQSTDAVRVYVAHLGRTFLKSQNVRGMSDALNRLIAPFVAMAQEEQRQEELSLSEAQSFVREVAELLRTMEDASNGSNGEVIDAEPNNQGE